MQATSQSKKITPALVVGTGISGLFTALKLAASGIETLLITKSSLDESNSRYAQGGIAAVLPGNAEDSLSLHFEDTIRAGAGLCNEAAVLSILSDGYAAIEDLLHYGVPFDRNADHALALGREAAHSVQRILHAGGDATGHSVEMALIDQVRQDSRISVMEYTQVVDLLITNGACVGAVAVDYRQQQTWLIKSAHIILATGGVGRIYSHTTNPSIATGDGIALASRAGAKIENMEFIQFHPTAFYAQGGLQFLVSEALRGEGGILRNHQGQAFAKEYHPDGELAPRDIVTRAIYSEMQASDQPFVYLDMTHLPPSLLEKRFPTILTNCLNFGVDIRSDLIPVAPAAHYLMGGITVDVNGAASIDGLYAVGETAYTGLHGANRLASNSLLECVVLARRVAHAISENPKTLSQTVLTDDLMSRISFQPRYQGDAVQEIIQEMNRLHQRMWQQVGILRGHAGLAQALSTVSRQERDVQEKQWHRWVPMGQELVNQLQVARLIIEAALQRTHSLGAHTRTDDPSFVSNVVAHPVKMSASA